MSRKRPYCLTIAGFDPSGGAGILADIKTFEQFRTHGLSVLTANTVQTEDSYEKTFWISQETIVEQLTTLLKRYPVTHFKVGLIENASILLAVLETIHTHAASPFILWDPILSASAGGDLDPQRFKESLPVILEKISLITPNIPEFEQLFGERDPAEVANTLNSEIYLKGGHAASKGKDFLYAGGKCYPFNSQVRTSLSKHGTGCILSAALTASRSLGYPLVKGVLKSKRYLERSLVSNPTLLAYHHF